MTINKELGRKESTKKYNARKTDDDTAKHMKEKEKSNKQKITRPCLHGHKLNKITMKALDYSCQGFSSKNIREHLLDIPY